MNLTVSKKPLGVGLISVVSVVTMSLAAYWGLGEPMRRWIAPRWLPKRKKAGWTRL